MDADQQLGLAIVLIELPFFLMFVAWRVWRRGRVQKRVQDSGTGYGTLLLRDGEFGEKPAGLIGYGWKVVGRKDSRDL